MPQIDRDLEKAAQFGEPSYVWRAGQERRWEMIRESLGSHLEGSVLDDGCGVGAYLGRLAERSSIAIGLEYDFPRAKEANRVVPGVVQGAGEHLPLPSGTFDTVLSMEVLEHVENDREAVEEIVRVLKPSDRTTGGRAVVFLPNRGYPFETHGIYWRGKYRFGNIPLVNYLPRRWRDELAPHVRVYTNKDVLKLLEGLPVKILEHTIIFGGYDNIIARWPTVGRLLRGLLQALERTPFKICGLSHFIVLERI